MINRNEKLAGVVRQISAEFIQKHSNRDALITVTSATLSPDLKKGSIMITVLPESKEKAVLEFVHRHLGDLRKELKQNINTKSVPFLEVVIDRGEKNRQKIDELLRNG